jgi:hypothetical protein
MKRIGLVAAVVAVFGCGLMGDAFAEQGPFTIILDVDVGSSASIGMGPGGMMGSFSMGGGPVSWLGQPHGVFVHNTPTVTMQGMMGQPSFQHRVMSFQIPGTGTAFVMMAGGSPWTGGKGIIMGGTDLLEGISGTVTVGDQVGPNLYPFTVVYRLP